MMRRSLLIVIAVFAAGLLAANASAAEQGQQARSDRITLQAHNSPFLDVLKSLFEGSGRNYMVDTNVGNSMVSALELKDVPWDQALRVLLRSADLVYRKDGDIYMIGRKRELPESMGGLRLMTAPLPAAPAGPRQPYVLQYVEPDFVIGPIRQIPGISDVQTYSAPADKKGMLVMIGTPEAVTKALELAKSVDVPWPTKAVEIRVEAKGTYHVKGKASRISLSNPAVNTPDGREATITSSSRALESTAGASDFSITVLPKVQPDGRVWLKGSVDAKWSVNMGKGVSTEASFAKVQIDTIMEPGKPQKVASVTTDLGKKGTAGLEIVATVKVSELKNQKTGPAGNRR